MQRTNTSATPSATGAPSVAAAPAPTATEVVRRPDPGVGRGLWEAPPWAFWVVASAAVVTAAVYAAYRLGWLARLRQRVRAR